jgi:alpha-beta hydrolase superfamily lysophospholipase
MIRAAIVSALFACLLAAACTPVVKPMGPAVTTPHIAPAGDRLIAADGAVLPLRSWLPKGAVKAVILGVHGFNDYSNTFAKPAKWWAKQGIATYAYDQRGFGAAPDHGYWPGTATLVSDLQGAARTIKARHPDLPLWLVGDSMGGAEVMVAMAEHRVPEIAGAVLVAPAVWGRSFMNPFERGGLWLLVRTIPWYPLTGQGLNRMPTDNIKMLVKLSRDPLVIKETRVDAVKGLVDLMDQALADASKLDGPPVLMLYGLNDEIVPEDPVFAAMRRMPKDGRNREALYPDGYHFLLRDLHAERIWRDIAAWIEDPHAPLPSGADKRAQKILAEKDEAAARRD